MAIEGSYIDTFNEPGDYTRESRDKLFETMNQATEKMFYERVDNIVLAEHEGVKITLREKKVGATYPYRFMVWYTPGTGEGWLATIDNLAKQYSSVLGRAIDPQDVIDRTQASLDAYLAAPEPKVQS